MSTDPADMAAALREIEHICAWAERMQLRISPYVIRRALPQAEDDARLARVAGQRDALHRRLAAVRALCDGLALLDDPAISVAAVLAILDGPA